MTQIPTREPLPPSYRSDMENLRGEIAQLWRMVNMAAVTEVTIDSLAASDTGSGGSGVALSDELPQRLFGTSYSAGTDTYASRSDHSHPALMDGLTKIRTSGGVDKFTFDADNSLATWPASSLSGAALIDGTVESSKLTYATQATRSVATGTQRDSRYSIFRYVSATPSTDTDPQGNYVSRMTTSGSLTADSFAFGDYAYTVTQAAADLTIVSGGPDYGSQTPDPGLVPGNYRATAYVRLTGSFTTPTAAVVRVQTRINGVVANATDFTPNQIGVGGYIGLSIPFTVATDSKTAGYGVNIEVLYRTASGQTGSLFVSHITAEYLSSGTATAAVTGTYERRTAITDAEIYSASVAKLTAGTIQTDDINLGTVGRLWTGVTGSTKSSGARLIFQGAVADSQRGIFAYNASNVETFGLQADGTLRLTGTLTVGSSTKTTSSFQVNGDVWMGAIQPLGGGSSFTAPTMSASASGGSGWPTVGGTAYWYAVQLVDQYGVPGPYAISATGVNQPNANGSVTVSWTRSILSGRYDSSGTQTLRVLRSKISPTSVKSPVNGAIWYPVATGLAVTATSFNNTVYSTGTLIPLKNQTLPGFFWDGSSSNVLTVNNDLTLNGNMTMGAAGTISTATSGARVEMSSSDVETLYYYTGDAAETAAGLTGQGIATTGTSRQANFIVSSSNLGQGTSQILVQSASHDNTYGALIELQSDLVNINGGIYQDITAGTLALSTSTALGATLNSVKFINGKAGVASVTTDASGNWTITHNLGTSSHTISVISNFGAAAGYLLSARATNTSTGQIRRIDTNTTVNSTAITLFYTVVPV